MFFFLIIIRCKNNHPTPKLSPEDVDTIAEIEDSIRDRANAFTEMEAFLPKKNGFVSTCYLSDSAANMEYECLFWLSGCVFWQLVGQIKLCTVVFDISTAVCIVSDYHVLLSRLYLTLVLGNVNVTLLNKQSK